MVSDKYRLATSMSPLGEDYNCRCACQMVGAIRCGKARMDLSLWFLHRQWLAGRPCVEDRPTCRSQGSSRRSGRFPALPYPPVEQMGLFPKLKVSVSRFRFPGGL
jgi:hypothetical protein